VPEGPQGSARATKVQDPALKIEELKNLKI
jgi:hypothetical protein